MSEGPDFRVDDAERQRAAAALEEHFKAGRLDSFAYEDRRGKALDAVTRADLDALFTDLPAPDRHPVPAEAGPPAGSGSPAQPGRSVRDTVMALLPFVALFLFFRTGEWLWFLAIPVGAIIVYGPGGRPDKRRDQRRDQGR